MTTAWGQALDTVDNPRFKSGDRPLLGFLLTTFGSFGLWLAWSARRRSGSWMQAPPSFGPLLSGRSTPVAAAAFVSVCAGIIAYGHLGFSVLATVILMVSLGVLLGALMVRRLRRAQPGRR